MNDVFRISGNVEGGNVEHMNLRRSIELNKAGGYIRDKASYGSMSIIVCLGIVAIACRHPNKASASHCSSFTHCARIRGFAATGHCSLESMPDDVWE